MSTRPITTGVLLVLFLSAFRPVPQPERAPGAGPVLQVAPAAGPIVVDGRLDDAGWTAAATIRTFYEVSPGDNVAAPVRTEAWVTYDDRYLYVAFRCEDPDPSAIRAPVVDRDGIGADQDVVAIALDTRGDRRSALLLFVNAGGVQGDGIRNDVTGDEDFAPDFSWTAATRAGPAGWSAELRIPFSSLRYTAESLADWGILFYRNYPRDYRYQLFNRPLPRGSSCEICHALRLAGLRDLAPSTPWTVAPHLTGERELRDWQAGVDAKWSPAPDHVVDLTLNPDFSQVEADAARITANQRFALFYPEKRPFFMEGVDLLQTPIQAAHTRTLTAPRWGVRATGRAAGSDYTLLTARDQGGGSVIVPGARGSELVAQPGASQASILRVRRAFGAWAAGLLVTDRESGATGHNRVVGPDLQWSLGAADRIAVQALVSWTRTPERPELFAAWDGRSLSGGDVSVSWHHDARAWSWLARYDDVGRGFRARNGFVPRVGYRSLRQQVGYSVYPTGLLRRVTPTLAAEAYQDRDGATLDASVRPGVRVEGRNGLRAELAWESTAERVDAALLRASRVSLDATVSPSRSLPGLGVSATLGHGVDYANAVVGRGGDVSAEAEVRLAGRVVVTVVAQHQWLDSQRDGRSGRLFSADAGRVQAQWSAGARARVRGTAQYTATRRDPALYPYPVAAEEGAVEWSLLFAYRLDWQSALYVGWGGQRPLQPAAGLERRGRQLFVKLSYALGR